MESRILSTENKKIKRFTDLIAWQEGHKLVLLIYKEIKNFPIEERFGLADQMRRAAVSITSNIAEGFTRKSSKEKYQFYNTAKASLTEIQNQLLIAKDVGYLNNNSFLKIAGQSITTNKLLNGLLKSTSSLSYINS